MHCDGTRQEGFEPPTRSLEGCRSIRLSYWRRCDLNLSGPATPASLRDAARLISRGAWAYDWRMRPALLLFLIAILSAPPTLPAQTTQVVLLGTGTPNADPDRSGPAVAIVVRGSVYLVDAGPGVVRRAAAAQRRGVPALAPANLRIVFLTHLHSDHTVGLTDLIFTPWVLERRAPLEVYGPAGTAAMAAHLVAAFREDIRIRTEGLEHANRTGYQVHSHEIRPGLIYADSNVRVTAFLVQHGSWPEAYGYRFDTADRSVVVSGDTRATAAVVDACHGCDVLVHEVYSQVGWAGRPSSWQRYHASFHTSAPDLGRIAARARPGLLVLYHQLLWSGTEQDVLADIRRSFTGRVVYGNDLDVY